MKRFRLQWTVLVAVVSLLIIAFVQPQQLGIVLVKLNILALAAVLSFMLDRELFPYANPRERPDHSMPQIRRAIIVGCAMIAAGIAL